MNSPPPGYQQNPSATQRGARVKTNVWIYDSRHAEKVGRMLGWELLDNLDSRGSVTVTRG